MSDRKQRGRREEGGKCVKQLHPAKQGKSWGEDGDVGEKKRSFVLRLPPTAVSKVKGERERNE